MLKKLLLTTFSIAAFSAAASVNAATYNFVDLIDGGAGAVGTFGGTLGNGTVVAPAPVVGGIGEDGYQTFTWTVDGLALTASATYVDVSTGQRVDAFGYLDAGEAGLGACKILGGSPGVNQCNPPGDDNVTLTEQLSISFEQTVSIDVAQMVFRDGGHDLMTPNGDLNKILLIVDGGSSFSIADLINNHGSVVTGMNFDFGVFPDNDQQFYISSLTAVPIPAAAWLFGSALIGLAGVARKRKLS